MLESKHKFDPEALHRRHFTGYWELNKIPTEYQKDYDLGFEDYEAHYDDIFENLTGPYKSTQLPASFSWTNLKEFYYLVGYEDASCTLYRRRLL